MALDILTATLQIKKQRSNTLKFLKKKKSSNIELSTQLNIKHKGIPKT